MDLDERIKLFEEILEEDPSSKLFFQLAKLYLEKNNIDKSISTLKFGLDKHPDHLEARLFLVELLTKNNLHQEVYPHIEKIHSVFIRYSSFWKKWAELLSQEGNYDLALIIFVLGILFKNENLSSLSQSLYKYLKEQEFLIEDEPIGEKTEDFKDESKIKEDVKSGEEESETHPSDEIDFKTRTMANILMAQGDYKGAINIFKELLEKESDPTKIAELKRSLKEAEQKLSAQPNIRHQKDAKNKRKKRRLLRSLKKLASRLEARAT